MLLSSIGCFSELFVGMGAGVELDEARSRPKVILHVYKWLDGGFKGCMLEICRYDVVDSFLEIVNQMDCFFFQTGRSSIETDRSLWKVIV